MSIAFRYLKCLYMSISFLDLCLNGLVIESSGILRRDEHRTLGFYNNHELVNGKRSFKHVTDERYLYWSPVDKWMVGRITAID